VPAPLPNCTALVPSKLDETIEYQIETPSIFPPPRQTTPPLARWTTRWTLANRKVQQRSRARPPRALPTRGAATFVSSRRSGAAARTPETRALPQKKTHIAGRECVARSR
jgi:hypothetical protein